MLFLFVHYLHFLVPSNVVCCLWPVYSVNLLCEAKEASVLYVIRRDVIMIVSSLSVITKAVKVFNAQVQTLKEKKRVDR